MVSLDPHHHPLLALGQPSLGLTGPHLSSECSPEWWASAPFRTEIGICQFGCGRTVRLNLTPLGAHKFEICTYLLCGVVREDGGEILHHSSSSSSSFCSDRQTDRPTDKRDYSKMLTLDFNISHLNFKYLKYFLHCFMVHL